MSRRWGRFLCLYRGGREPSARSCLAHIFPDVLGGVRACDDTTCLRCNGITNREVEQEAGTRLAAFRSMWGVPNRRGSGAKVKALVRGPGFAESIRVTDPSFIQEAITRSNAGQGEAQYIVVGPADAVERKVAEISQMRPEVAWRGADVQVETSVAIESHPDAPVFLRLATKIALERLADVRGPTFAREPEFADARDFALTGSSARIVAGCLADPRWVGMGAPLAFPIPLHAVGLVGQHEDRVLGAVVVLFGLYTYWVILSDTYYGLAPWDDLLCENPVTQATDQPLLRTGTSHLRLPWRDWRHAPVTLPDHLRRVQTDHVMRKLQASADAHYG